MLCRSHQRDLSARKVSRGEYSGMLARYGVTLTD